jgi:capsular polysaccharide export protein
MNNNIGNIKNKNVLFLQGPMGNFFKRLDKEFKKYGVNTFKIGFNGGDEYFSNRGNYIPYRGEPKEWHSFIAEFLKEHNIHKVFLFGDCRFYQSIASQEASKQNIEVFVFEEGYIRPDYITLEKHGVNDFSTLPRDPDFYKNLGPTVTQKATPTKNSFLKLMWSLMRYYIAANIMRFRYPHYIHHRSLSSIKETLIVINNLRQKILYKFTEQHIYKSIENDNKDNFYFVPLQTHNDFQLIQHSPFDSIESFIKEVIISFATYAPKDKKLLFKHHPVDRGRKNYNNFLQKFSQLHSVAERVISVHDAHLPTCLKNSIGTITINSTVGLSSILHEKPTLTMGAAVYDIEGLTCHKLSLNEFWTQYYTPDMSLYENYRTYLIKNSQINASFYGNICEDFISVDG